MKIGIFFGGNSREREVSFAGGRTVYDNLDKTLFDAIPIFVDSFNNFILLDWHFIYKGSIRDFYPPVSALKNQKTDVQVYAENLASAHADNGKSLIKKLGKKKLFHVGVNSVYSKVASEILSQQLKEINEEDKTIQAILSGEKLLNQGTFKFDEVVKAIAEAKPDLIINTLSGDSNRDYFRALRTQGIKGSTIPTLSFHISAEILQELDVESCTGDFVGWNYLPSIETEQNKEFLEKVKTKLGSDTIVNDSMEAGYYGVYLWAKAVREAKSFEPDK
jgi:ABC-type branched-subunit amino acid transport system substrate-binding protein